MIAQTYSNSIWVFIIYLHVPTVYHPKASHGKCPLQNILTFKRSVVDDIGFEILMITLDKNKEILFNHIVIVNRPTHVHTHVHIHLCMRDQCMV